MADLKISQMTLDATPVGTDIFPIVSGGANYKAALSTLGKAVGNISQSQIVSSQVLSSFSNTAGTHEVGTTLNNITLNWAYNRAPDPTSQSIDSGVGDVAVNLRTIALTGQGLTSNHTYTITAVGDDGTNSYAGTTVSGLILLNAIIFFFLSSYTISSAINPSIRKSFIIFQAVILSENPNLL